MELYFSDYFSINPGLLEIYGAVDISVASDLPLFIDPFLLFNSDKHEYKALHEEILRYLRFLRDKAVAGQLSPGRVADLFQFKEVKQNWLGFTVLGNEGHALGPQFAAGLKTNLGTIFSSFGDEEITASSHLEKVALISSKVGRDGISDFTTCLIKHYLAEYTQTFALQHLTEDQRGEVAVARASFNYMTETWQPATFILPIVRDDYVLLTPADMLTRDETWINSEDLFRRFRQIPESVGDISLRANISDYFERQLGLEPKREDFRRAVESTIREYPVLLDYYIKMKEADGDEAVAISARKVADTENVFIQQVRQVYDDLKSRTPFYDQAFTSYEEALARVKGFKQYVENQDGYRLINRGGDKPFSDEKEVQLFFGLIWFGSRFDVNREPNNGRGPVDYKVSIGAADKSLIEFKLGSNKQLKRNMQKQVEIYEAANQTPNSVKAILCYTADQEQFVRAVLSDLKLSDAENIVLIDARSDNKPSASKA